jgi:hypothetical protein
MGSVAAPLLAGFAITIGTLVVTNGSAFRWPNLVLILLVCAASSLVAAVELTFRVRQYTVTPADIEMWWPNPTEHKKNTLRREQRYHRAQYLMWSDRARVAYNLGILLLALGFAVALIPAGHVSAGRWTAAGFAFLAFLAEAVWTAHSTFGWFWRARPVELPLVGPDINSPSREAAAS